MTSLNNLNYYRRSMNSIQSFDDGMGATMENGAIVCNSFSTDNFTATTLNATTGNITTLNSNIINNTGTITTDNFTATTLNATTGNITTLNSNIINNTGTITTDILFSNNIVYADNTLQGNQVLTNSLNPYPGLTTIDINATAKINNIETKLTTDELNISGKVINFNGTQPSTKMYMSKYNNNSLEFSTNTGIAYIDFHSSNTTNDYDARILCEGGTTTGKGYLSMVANTIELNTSHLFLKNIFGPSTVFDASYINCDILNGTTTNVSTINASDINTSTIISNLLNASTANISLLNTSSINNTGTTTTGTLASTTINNTGTATTGTLASTTINNTGTTTTGTLASTTINNTGTTTTNTLNATTATITTLNIDSISPTTLNCSNLNCSAIQSINTGNTFNFLTNNTGDINIGNTGTVSIYTSTTGKTYLSKNGNYSVETGINTNTAYIDFHSSNTTSDYDTRIITTGGSSTAGQGTLDLKANTIYNTTNSNSLCRNPSNNNYNIVASTTIASNYAQLKFKSLNSTNDYDTMITSVGGTSGTDGMGTLILNADIIRLNGQVAFTDFITTQTVGGKSLNTNYTNYKTSPIFVSVSATATVPAAWFYAKTDSSVTPTTIVAQSLLYNNVAHSIFFIVLPGKNYRVEATGGGGISLLNWTEWT